MVKIRLSRRGKKNSAFFHVVVCDSRKKRDGAVLDNLGNYDPKLLKGEEKLKINRERYAYWMSKGAQPTETVVQIFNSSAK